MRISRTWSFVLCCSALAVLAAACSGTSRNGSPAVSTGLELNMIAETNRLAQEQFALGRYKRSMDIYAQAYDTHHHMGLRRGYAKLGEQIKAVADTSYQKKNYSEAGTTYRVMFESGITTRDFAHQLDFDDEYLSTQIAACSRALMEIGFLKYREDKLEEALTHWKQVIAFDVNNKEVKGAIERATIQLQNLNSLK